MALSRQTGPNGPEPFVRQATLLQLLRPPDTVTSAFPDSPTAARRLRLLAAAFYPPRPSPVAGPASRTGATV